VHGFHLPSLQRESAACDFVRDRFASFRCRIVSIPSSNGVERYKKHATDGWGVPREAVVDGANERHRERLEKFDGARKAAAPRRRFGVTGR
jgi:hypothetical protein